MNPFCRAPALLPWHTAQFSAPSVQSGTVRVKWQNRCREHWHRRCLKKCIHLTIFPELLLSTELSPELRVDYIKYPKENIVGWEYKSFIFLIQPVPSSCHIPAPILFRGGRSFQKVIMSTLMKVKATGQTPWDGGQPTGPGMVKGEDI